jgi:hypothetical protein
MASEIPEKQEVLGPEWVDDEAIKREFNIGDRQERLNRQRGAPHLKFGRQIRYHVPTFRKWLVDRYSRT